MEHMALDVLQYGRHIPQILSTSEDYEPLGQGSLGSPGSAFTRIRADSRGFLLGSYWAWLQLQVPL